MSVYRTIGPLVYIFVLKHRLWLHVRTALMGRIYHVHTIYVLSKNRIYTSVTEGEVAGVKLV